ncbi:hypothetical protein B1R94_28815 [Mycolicibacterium litorale]|nr:hypothetical protein B1R94_28815 [Mycolicibacterium litorale]
MTLRHTTRAATIAGLLLAVAPVPTAHADNVRLNNSVVTNVSTIQQEAGCTTRVHVNPQLRLAAQWHAADVLTNHALDGNIGSDGSSPQSRASAAGFAGAVTETVAITPSLAINNVDVLNQWYYDPVAHGIMADCDNSQIGVWSENSWDRSVVVAVYGRLYGRLVAN